MPEIISIPETHLRLSEMMISLSTALDLSKVKVLEHSERVAYMTYMLGQELKMDEEELNQAVLAALLHDIGFEKDDSKLEALSDVIVSEELMIKHCQRGYNLIKDIDCLQGLAGIILSHHDKWQGENATGREREEIPLPARIIHLVDRVDALIDKEEYILYQLEDVLENIETYNGFLFDPYLVREFNRLAGREAFWLDLHSGAYRRQIKDWGKNTRREIALNDLEQIAGLFASIIDMKSTFTTRHSVGVATIAAMIAGEMGFDFRSQQAIRIAGLLHDLGKMTVPNGILEKNGKLTTAEYKVIKQHTYYTYSILSSIDGFAVIPEWAAYHHEKIDGSGYPFHLKDDEISTGSRIMAVSDIFQALTEERPYRDAMTVEKAVSIVEEEAEAGKLDRGVVQILQKTM